MLIFQCQDKSTCSDISPLRCFCSFIPYVRWVFFLFLLVKWIIKGPTQGEIKRKHLNIIFSWIFKTSLDFDHCLFDQRIFGTLWRELYCFSIHQILFTTSSWQKWKEKSRFYCELNVFIYKSSMAIYTYI